MDSEGSGEEGELEEGDPKEMKVNNGISNKGLLFVDQTR